MKTQISSSNEYFILPLTLYHSNYSFFFVSASFNAYYNVGIFLNSSIGIGVLGHSDVSIYIPFIAGIFINNNKLPKVPS